jgi:hypothetical protein
MTSRVLALLAVSSVVGGSAGEPLSVRVPGHLHVNQQRECADLTPPRASSATTSTVAAKFPDHHRWRNRNVDGYAVAHTHGGRHAQREQ